MNTMTTTNVGVSCGHAVPLKTRGTTIAPVEHHVWTNWWQQEGNDN